MKNLIILIILLPVLAFSQLPSYPVVLKSFFNSYSFHSDQPTLAINFAKKKDGWYVQVVNQMTEKVQSEQLFWSIKDSSFHLVQGMPEGLSKDVAEKEVERYLNGQASMFNFYGYE